MTAMLHVSENASHRCQKRGMTGLQPDIFNPPDNGIEYDTEHREPLCGISSAGKSPANLKPDKVAQLLHSRFGIFGFFGGKHYDLAGSPM